MVDKVDMVGRVQSADVEEQLEDASASPTEEESVETMRRVPIMDEEREDSTGWGSKMRGNVKLCGREMPVARRTAYLCTVPLIVALAVLAGCLISYIVIIKSSRGGSHIPRKRADVAGSCISIFLEDLVLTRFVVPPPASPRRPRDLVQADARLGGGARDAERTGGLRGAHRQQREARRHHPWRHGPGALRHGRSRDRHRGGTGE